MSIFLAILLILVLFPVILLFLRVYCRLTAGICNSKQDMSGKTVLITGASAGIGKATALDLARRNARVLLACRNMQKAEKVKSEIVSLTGNENLKVIQLNLESFNSVRECAKEVLSTEERLDVLINNAGCLADESSKLTEDGCNICMQSNYFGHFLLTLLLIDLLQKSKPSRIINLSSIMHLFAFLNLQDLNYSRRNLFTMHIINNYSRSKLAMILFTRELAKRLEGTGVTVNAVHPGLILTDLFYSSSAVILSIFRFFTYCIGKSTEEGAQTSIYLAVHPKVERTSGKFFYDCRERWLFGEARNSDKARKLFEISEKIVKETYPKKIKET